MHEKGNITESLHTCKERKETRVKSRGIMNTCMSKTGSMREKERGIRDRDKEIIRSMNTYMRKKQ